MLTMQEIRAKNYKVFPTELTTDQRTRQESSLKYIEHLASISGNDISHWNAIEIFTKDGMIPKDRNKLNQLFFTYLERDKVSRPVETKAMPTEIDSQAEAVCYAFDQKFAGTIDARLKMIEESIHMKKSELARYSKELEKRVTQLRDFEWTLRGMKVRKKEGIGLTSDLKKVLTEGWWTLDKAGPVGIISLITPEIRLTFMNNDAKIATAVTLGRYLLRVTVPKMSLAVSVHPYANNPDCEGYYHPHVTGEGAVCTGEMSDDFHEACNNFNLHKLTTIMRKTLTSYNDESPYIELHELEAASREGNIILSHEDEMRTQQEILAVIDSVNFTEEEIEVEQDEHTDEGFF